MKSERGLILCFLLIVVALSVNACNRGENSVDAADEALTTDERDFVEQAQEIHAAEIKMGRMALEKSQNGDVRDYADIIVDDHEEGLEQLVDVMKERRIPQARSLVPETQKDIERMAALSGIEFDREFINMMVADHKKAYALFKQKSAGLSRGRLQEYATDLLPTLEKHLTKAQELQSKLFNGARP
jgi:putative membrane protein